jgi:hypothetical protein
MSKNFDEIAKRYGGVVTMDDIAARYGGTVSASPQLQPPALPRPRPIPDLQTPNALERAVQNSPDVQIGTGLAQSLGRTALAAKNALSYPTTGNVTPSPLSLEPANSMQRAGQSLGFGGQAAMLAALTGGSSLPAQVAAGGLGGGLLAAAADEDPRIGGAVGMAAPIAGATVSKIVNALTTKFPRQPALTVEQQIAQKLAPSTRNAVLANEVVPELAQNPRLVTAKPGSEFDQALIDAFKQAGSKVRTVESAIPDETLVPKKSLLDGFDDLIAKYDRNGADDAVRMLQKQKAIIEDIPTSGRTDTMTWDRFIANKRRFGTDAASAFKRIGNETASEKDYAMVELYGKFMDTSKGISDELSAANAKFASLRKALTAAGIDEDIGRASLYGKGPVADIARGVAVAKALMKHAAPTSPLSLYGGYRALKDIWGQ